MISLQFHCSLFYRKVDERAMFLETEIATDFKKVRELKNREVDHQKLLKYDILTKFLGRGTMVSCQKNNWIRRV